MGQLWGFLQISANGPYQVSEIIYLTNIWFCERFYSDHRWLLTGFLLRELAYVCIFADCYK